MDDIAATIGLQGAKPPLCIAAECGHVDVVAYLLSVEADAKYINTRGFTPLHFAASSHRRSKFIPP